MAIGATGSGKTYTMMGDTAPGSEHSGFIPRLCHKLFEHIKGSGSEQGATYKVQLSMVEVYNEKVRDLLHPPLKPLQVRQHSKYGIYVNKLRKVAVTSVEEVASLTKEALGCRAKANTNTNNTRYYSCDTN